jgi:hypothetical protein
MIEFGHSIRFYYIFRATYWGQDVQEIYKRLGLNVTHMELDLLVWNDDAKNELKKIVKSDKKIELNVEHFRDVQKRDIGVYFGADNPWISNPPDNHPCMPGIPDDEANAILFQLLFSDPSNVENKSPE